jgi:hypothetical protein
VDSSELGDARDILRTSDIGFHPKQRLQPYDLHRHTRRDLLHESLLKLRAEIEGSETKTSTEVSRCALE